MAEGSGRFIEIGMPGSDCCVCELNVNTNNSQEHCMDGVGLAAAYLTCVTRTYLEAII